MHIVAYSLSFFELNSCCIMLIICCICCCWCCCWLSAWIWIGFCRSSICSFLSFCWNSLSFLYSSSWSSLNFNSRSAFFSSHCRVSPPDLRFFLSFITFSDSTDSDLFEVWPIVSLALFLTSRANSFTALTFFLAVSASVSALLSDSSLRWVNNLLSWHN